MTVEELREEYEKESGKSFKMTVTSTDNFVYFSWKTAYDYIEWLEQKLTQPCPECEKHKKAVEKLIKKVMVDNYTEELDDDGMLLSREDWMEWAYDEDV